MAIFLNIFYKNKTSFTSPFISQLSPGSKATCWVARDLLPKGRCLLSSKGDKSPRGLVRRNSLGASLIKGNLHPNYDGSKKGTLFKPSVHFVTSILSEKRILGSRKLVIVGTDDFYLDKNQDLKSSLYPSDEGLPLIKKIEQPSLYLSFKKPSLYSVNQKEIFEGQASDLLKEGLKGGLSGEKSFVTNSLVSRQFSLGDTSPESANPQNVFFEPPSLAETQHGKTTKNLKKYNTSYSKLSEVKLLTIGIASPLRILQWAEKTLPNGKIYGEVLNANTLHHKTFKPQKGGLFCERIFGPLKDFECACGKTDLSVKKLQTASKKTLSSQLPSTSLSSQENPSTEVQGQHDSDKTSLFSINSKLNVGVSSESRSKQTGSEASQQNLKISRKFCPDCDVEYTWSVIRRYQLGYIKLNSPVTHIWFLKGTPSYLSLLLDMKKRYLQFVTYCSETLTLEKSSLPFYPSNDSFIYKKSVQETLGLKTNNSPTFQNPTNPDVLAGTLIQEPKESKDQHYPNSLGSAKDVPPGATNDQYGTTTVNKVSKKDWRKNWKSNNLLIKHKKGWYLNKVSTQTNLNNSLSETKDDFVLSPFEPKNLPFILSSSHTSPISKRKRDGASMKDGSLKLAMPKDFQKTVKLQAALKISSPVGTNLRGEEALKRTNLLKETLNNKEAFLLSTLLLSIYYKALPNLMGWVQQVPLGSEATQSPLDLSIAQRSKGHEGSKTEEKNPLSMGNISDESFGSRLLRNNLAEQQAPFFAHLSTNERRADVPNVKMLFKKLPVDLYILCTLESLLHKPSLNFSIKKSWEILSKKSFVTAINKAHNILDQFFVLNQTNGETLNPTSVAYAENQNNFLEQTESHTKETITNVYGISNAFEFKNKEFQNKGTLHANLPLFSANQTVASHGTGSVGTGFSISNADSDAHDSSNVNTTLTLKRSQLLLRTLKAKYASHVLKLLETLKYPILSLHSTTQLSKQNSIHEVQNFIISEMTPYFLTNTEYLENILSELFLNSLLSDQFIYMYQNQSAIASKLFYHKVHNVNNHVKLSHKSKKVNPKLTLFLKTLKHFVLSKQRKSKMVDPLLQSPALFSTSNIRITYSKKPNQSNFQLGALNPINAWETSGAAPSYPGSAETAPFGSETTQRVAPEAPEARKPLPMFSKKKIYNNVYTLSHRERWDADKDWYIFSLFTFGLTEFTDYPISTYKNRFVHSESLDPTLNISLNSVRPSGSSGSSLSVGSLGLNKNSSIFKSSSSFYSGAGIVQQLLNEFDLDEIQKLDKQNRLLLYQLNKSILNLKKIAQIFIYDKTTQVKLKELCKKRDLLIRRTKLVRKIFRKNTNPASMILTVLPVLPPDLRPIVKMGSQIAASDLNRLYQKVIYRNDRLKKFLKDPATSQSYEMKYAQRLLQEAVDNLMQNGKSGPNSEKDARGRALKSLSDILKGKQGRFRQFLLGKRVDYSGRSVIVVGPKLKLHECGLPLEMAKELYLPFILKSILNKNYTKTVVGAKTLMQKNPSLVNQLLNEIMQVTPVLLNRAPTLHRLGIQAFVPKLIEGRAILLHPLVCSAFNADFDGDQMAVHVPITVEARAEAWKMLLSTNNLLSPATGEPLAIPSQDMVLGCYYLTTFSNKSQKLRGSGMYFNHLYDVIKLYEQELIDIHSFVWIKWPHLIQNGSDQESPLELRISPFGQWQEITSNYQKTYNSKQELLNLYMCTTPGRILFNSIVQQIL